MIINLLLVWDGGGVIYDNPDHLFAEYAFSEHADGRGRVQPKYDVKPSTGN